jgi:hypothetical protein
MAWHASFLEPRVGNNSDIVFTAVKPEGEIAVEKLASREGGETIQNLH